MRLGLAPLAVAHDDGLVADPESRKGGLVRQIVSHGEKPGALPRALANPGHRGRLAEPGRLDLERERRLRALEDGDLLGIRVEEGSDLHRERLPLTHRDAAVVQDEPGRLLLEERLRIAGEDLLDARFQRSQLDRLIAQRLPRAQRPAEGPVLGDLEDVGEMGVEVFARAAAHHYEGDVRQRADAADQRPRRRVGNRIFGSRRERDQGSVEIRKDPQRRVAKELLEMLHRSSRHSTNQCKRACHS